MPSYTESEQASVPQSEDIVRQYLNEIKRFPRLTPEEERSLARLCAEGDEDAIRRMVNCNLRLVVSVAKEYSGRGVPLLDLIQEGSIGLIAAARKFDYTLDFRFSTYATKWIRQGVTRCLMNHGALIRVPLHTAERMRKVAAVKNALLQETGCDPTVEEIAQRSGIPADKVEKLMAFSTDTCSLDTPVGDEEEATLGLLVEDVQAVQPQEWVIREELESTLDSLMSMLNDRQRQVLRLHFGMEDGVCHSLDEVGKKLGISKERARQIERQAIEKMKKYGAGMGLEDFGE